MGYKESFMAELKQESSMTKKILDRVPIEKKDWKPHPKSMSLGKLATHIAYNTHWFVDILNSDVFNFLTDYDFSPKEAETKEELLDKFQTNLDKALTILSQSTQEDFDKTWTVKRGEAVIFAAPKKVSMRGWGLNHMIHHRGQLSVYLRLLDVPVPGMYGPSADES